MFSGTIRNHAEGRSGVEHLTYEAYEEQVVPRFAEIGAELRRRWPDTGRVALLHRLGQIEIGESSVIAVVSAPHRAEAFEAARYAIDALKESAPIWKHEVWADGADWGTGAHDRGRPSVGEERRMIAAVDRRRRRGRRPGRPRRCSRGPQSAAAGRHRVVPSADRCTVARGASTDIGSDETLRACRQRR